MQLDHSESPTDNVMIPLNGDNLHGPDSMEQLEHQGTSQDFEDVYIIMYLLTGLENHLEKQRYVYYNNYCKLGNFRI